MEGQSLLDSCRYTRFYRSLESDLANRIKGLPMRRLVLATLALAGFSPVALAADLPVKAAAPMTAMVAAYNWTGWYAGLNAGGAWGRSDANTSPIFDPAGYFATTSPAAIAVAGA